MRRAAQPPLSSCGSAHGAAAQLARAQAQAAQPRAAGAAGGRRASPVGKTWTRKARGDRSRLARAGLTGGRSGRAQKELSCALRRGTSTQVSTARRDVAQRWEPARAAVGNYATHTTPRRRTQEPVLRGPRRGWCSAYGNLVKCRAKLVVCCERERKERKVARSRDRGSTVAAATSGPSTRAARALREPAQLLEQVSAPRH